MSGDNTFTHDSTHESALAVFELPISDFFSAFNEVVRELGALRNRVDELETQMKTLRKNLEE